MRKGAKVRGTCRLLHDTPAMAQMREIAFGHNTTVGLIDILVKAMVPSPKIQRETSFKAEDKRRRKLERNRKIQEKSK